MAEIKRVNEHLKSQVEDLIERNLKDAVQMQEAQHKTQLSLLQVENPSGLNKNESIKNLDHPNVYEFSQAKQVQQARLRLNTQTWTWYF